MCRPSDRDTDRGQAYTLEGLISAMVVLMAVLFALQAVVITPTTGGLGDRTVQVQVQQETQDALVVAAGDQPRNLSNMLRYWDGNGGFQNASSPHPDGYDVYQADKKDNFTKKFTLGDVLYNRFGDNGQNYNVEAHYTNGNDHETRTLVYHGNPPASAVTASYTVTLYEDQHTTGDEDRRLRDFTPENRTIPRDANTGDYIYNVVELRVIVW